MAQTVKARTGGHLAAETLEALGAEVAFGVPGIHALPVWEGLRATSTRAVGFRTELNAGFAADGYARASGRPAPLLLSTGPGALIALAALMEAASAHVPVLAIASQIPRELAGAGRGYLHELPDQLASFAPVVKWAVEVEDAERLPETLAEGWRRALTAPSGPVFVQVPEDVLTGPAGEAPARLDAAPPTLPLPPAELLRRVAGLLARAERPAVWAGGGVQRSGAWGEVREVAERLGAPVATTYMGKGTLPEDHELAVGSACDEPAVRTLLEEADVLLCVGTELGAETTGQYAFAPGGTVVQVDAMPARIGATYPALGLVGDARAVLGALLELLPDRRAAGEERAAAVRARLGPEGHELERRLLAAIREVLPREAVHAWDMTILGYWAAAHFPALAPRRFLYPLGSGTLGYAWPAALGASLALPETPVLAVAGDGGILYGLAELATARQHGLSAALLVVDDGGYGVLREYQREAFGATTAVDLEQPDFPALAASFGVPAEATAPEGLGDALARALAAEGPALVHLPARLAMWSS